MKCLKKTVEESFNIDQILGNLTSFKVSYLDASSRLNISKEAPSSMPDEPPQNSLQGLYRLGKGPLGEIREIFERAFDLDILLDYSGLKNLRFKVSKTFPEIPSDPQEAYSVLKPYQNLDDQGDGFKSLVGIIISFILSRERILLLDEPEAFLHPKQCRLLGYWIANYTLKTENQIIVSTHSGSFLAGILAVNADVNVFRMNRRENVSELVALTPDSLQKLSGSPLLSGQPIFESLFHEGVIVCEGDADRILYQTVAARYRRNSSVFFVHSHSKQTLKDVVKLMKISAVPVGAIADIDILDSPEDLCSLLNALDPEKDYGEIMSLRNEISNEILGKSEREILQDMLIEINDLVSDIRNSPPLAAVRSRLANIHNRAGRWSEIKSKGISILSETQKYNAIRLIDICKSHGLFIVHKGELESWMDLGTGRHKKGKWIISAMERLNENCPEDLEQFVREAIEYLQK